MPPAARKPAAKTSTPRRRATTSARKTAKPPAPAPVVVLTSTDDPDDEGTFPLFEINGTVHTMPARPSAGLALAYLDDFDKFGEGYAGMRLLKTLIGDDAYRALSQFKGLRAEDIGKITDAAMKLTLGALEEADPAGN